MAKLTNEKWRYWLGVLQEFERWSGEQGLPIDRELTRVKAAVRNFGNLQKREERRIAALDALEAQRERELIEEERRSAAPSKKSPPPATNKKKQKSPPKALGKRVGNPPKTKRDAGRFTGKIKGLVLCDRCHTKHLDGWRFRRDSGDTQIICRYCRAPILEKMKFLQQGKAALKEADDAMRRRVSGSYGSGKR